jgi:lysine-ketoglutarate reductase/saccharopine dehydrogenase-like protein (TIGR00300 family)
MENEIVEVKGHIIDSLTLPKILDEVMNLGGGFEILEMKVGQRRQDPSHARVKVCAPSRPELEVILARIKQQGALPIQEKEAILAMADQDGVFPEGFYCTTHLQTFIYYQGQWLEVQNPEMDCGIVIDCEARRAFTVPMHHVKRGQFVLIGHQGVRVVPQERSPERNVFEFMASSVSSEKPKGVLIREIANQIVQAKRHGGKVLWVAGPALVHTGAGEHLVRMIREGFVDVLFAGNALATHDIEQALFGTSLGVSLEKGMPTVEGHEHHVRAVNLIRRMGGVRQAVRQGVLKSGMMYHCIQHGVDFVLAGSIRDDGPLPEVITDVLQAQDEMRKRIPGVEVCVMIATALHSIAVGNLLPARVKTICIDINPAVVTKLVDRGSFQAIGLVTDVEPFLRALWGFLKQSADLTDAAVS